jgi:hypothetical protein
MRSNTANRKPTASAPPAARGANPSPARSNDKSSQPLFNEAAIRLRAYQKWESAGRPDGDGIGFWLEAERELHAGAKA